MSIATKLTALSGHITNAYDAVSTKGGTIPANKNMANLDDAILSIPSGGGEVTNGVIEQHAATGGNIPANTFVEIIADFSDVTASSATGLYEVGTSRASSRRSTTVAVLDETHVFVTFLQQGKTYGAVCAISGDSITPGAAVQLTAYSNSASTVSSLALDESTVFVTYRSGASERSAVVCSISGDAVTVNTPVALTGMAFGLHSNAAILDNGDVLVVDGGNQMKAVVLTISGTTITAGSVTDVANVSTYYSADYERVGLDVVSAGSAVIAYHQNSTQYLAAKVLTISGTTITAGSEVTLTSSTVTGVLVKSLSAESVLIAYETGASAQTVTCSVSGDTLVAGEIATVGINNYAMNVIDVDAKTFLLGYSEAMSSSKLTIVPCTINGGAATIGQPVSISGASWYDRHLGALNAQRILDAGVNRSNVFQARFLDASLLVSPSQTKIDGLTAEDITMGEAGDVWVLNAGA